MAPVSVCSVAIVVEGPWFDPWKKRLILASKLGEAMPNGSDKVEKSPARASDRLGTEVKPAVELDALTNPKPRRFLDCVLAIEKWIFVKC